MNNAYYIELKSYPIRDYFEVLKGMDFIPRRILNEDIENRFALLEREGINDLQSLSAELKTNEKIETLARKTGIPKDFLQMLKRELSGFQRPPCLLKDFPGVDHENIERLENAGIRNAKQFFEASVTRADRIAIAERYEIVYDEVLELAKLCDVSRLYGVGPVFARLLVDSGTDTVPKIANADPKGLFEKLMKINGEKGYTKTKFKEKDMVYCRNFAKNFPSTDNYPE